jgi:uncharacterized protein YndB with AHSA1/START domain
VTAEATSRNSFTSPTFAPPRKGYGLTDPQTIRKYWFGMTAECDFKPGSSWDLKFEDGRTADTGEILEADPPRRLVIR